jgi:membrane protein implicated in regulation of membrane protease activity
LVLGLYLALAIVGGGLVLLAALGGVLGGHDAEVSATDTDVHVDGPDLHMDHPGSVGDHSPHELESLLHHTAELPRDPAVWLPFLTIRFWIYLAATFGLTGTALSLFRASQEPITLIASLLTGIFVALIGSYAWRVLNVSQVDASTKSKDFIGSTGRLSVGTRPGSLGRVRLYINGEWIDMTAISDIGSEIPEGEEVIVVSIEGSTVRVIPSREIVKELNQENL